MTYDHLVDAYERERLTVVRVWSEFRDEDLPRRPRQDDPRGRSVQEQMARLCTGEDVWFRTMLGIDTGAPPLPQPETRLALLARYAADSATRLAALRAMRDDWWDARVPFFDVQRSRAWIMRRRLAHTAHHRQQMVAMLRAFGLGGPDLALKINAGEALP